MVMRLFQTSVALACLLLIASASSASAQSYYLAPIPAPASSSCGDTAPDCAAICNTCRGSEGACQSSTPIGDYLRANCKSTCGLCDSPSTIPSTFMTAGVPSPSKGMQLPLAYGVRSGTLSPSPCTFSCVDIPPPDSPFTCAEQITCGRCYGTSSCNSRLATPISLESIVTGMRIPVIASTPLETSPDTLSPLPATPASIGVPIAVASPQTSGMPAQSTPTNSTPAVSASAPAGTSRSPNTGVPDLPMPPSPSLQSASPTSSSPAILSPTPSNEFIQASPPFTAFSTLPPPAQAAGTNPASTSPAPADLSPAPDSTPASFSNAVGQDGPTAPAPSSTPPETAAGTPMAPSPTMLPPLFGSPAAYGSGSSPVQAYVPVSRVPPVQSPVPVPAITNAETANPDASATLPVLPASPTETPTAATGTPGTSANLCFDIPPPQTSYTCVEQRDLGKCDAPFMVAASPEAPSGYCQITCNRCSIPGSTETTGAPAATSLTPSPNVLSNSNEASNPVAGSSLPSPPPPASGIPGASNLLPPQTALSPSMTSPSSPSSPGHSIGSSPSPVGSPSSSSTVSPPAAPTDDISNVPAPSQPVLPLPGALGSVSAPAAPPDSEVQLSVPTPGNLPSAAVNSGLPAGPPAVTPGECVDLVSDCKLICQQMTNDCSQPGGVGDYLRANCKQTCNLCPSSSPPTGCTKYTWLTGQWGVCNDTCGIGFHNRSVSCLSYGPSLALQGEADAALCDAAVKPDNTTTCITLPCAADYSAACAVTVPAAPGRRLQGLMIL